MREGRGGKDGLVDGDGGGEREEAGRESSSFLL